MHMVAPRSYTTQLQAGLGMINETLDLLRLWEPGDTPTRLSERAISHGTFARATARRARNIVAEMFAPRYLAQNDQPAKWLKELVEANLPMDDLAQLFFIYTARAQAVFADFVTEVYWPRYSAGALRLGRSESEGFIYRGLDSGRMQKRWTQSTVRRVSGYILGCCSDFGLLDAASRSDRTIRRFTIRPKVVLYLAHELHFSGLSDAAVVYHHDWRLFGLENHEGLTEVKKLANDGHLIVQSSADVVQIAWKYRNMEECTRALAQR